MEGEVVAMIKNYELGCGHCRLTSEIKGLVGDIIRQLLSSCILLGNAMDGQKNNHDLLQADQQLTLAVETMLRIRALLIYSTFK